MKEKLNNITSTAVPLNIANIDTDQIIPARFLKATSREGFGENIFRDWRYNKDGSEKLDFPLNEHKYTGKILVAGKNFGCGSSREHAAWAIHDYGFKVVISSYFADIFKNNALNNGILPLQVSDDCLDKVFDLISKKSKAEISISLETQTLIIPEIDCKQTFEINKYKKECLINGYDDIDYLISIREKIEEFEKY
jgi:3-isopropylmalate/(R)-2-methylmalate dehydratase small subunit